MRRPIHSRQIRDGLRHGLLPADGNQEGEGERRRRRLPFQGSVPEAPRGDLAPEQDSNPRLQGEAPFFLFRTGHDLLRPSSLQPAVQAIAAEEVHPAIRGADAGRPRHCGRLLPQSAGLGEQQRPRHRPRPHRLPLGRRRWIHGGAHHGGGRRRTCDQRQLGPRRPSPRSRPEQLRSPALGHHLQSSAEDSERSSPVSSGGAVMEQPHSDDGGDGRDGGEQRREGEIPHRPHLQRPPAGGLRTEVVGLGAAPGQRRQRQPPPHLGPLHRLLRLAGGGGAERVAAPVRRPHGRREGPRLVPLPEQPARLGRRRRRPLHQVLEHPHRRLPQLRGHRLPGVLSAVEQEREGAPELPWLHPEPAHPLEVPLHGEDGGAHRPHLPRPLHGTEPGWVHGGLGGGGRDAEVLERLRDSRVGGAEASQGRHQPGPVLQLQPHQVMQAAAVHARTGLAGSAQSEFSSICSSLFIFSHLEKIHTLINYILHLFYFSPFFNRIVLFRRIFKDLFRCKFR